MKKERKWKRKIKDLKKTERGKAIWKLIKWGIFFGCLFIFVFVSAIISSLAPKEEKKETPIKDEVPSKSEEEILNKNILKTKLEELRDANYHYEYQIYKLEEGILFSGEKQDGYQKGYKEDKNGIIKYYIDETGIYQETLDDKILIDNLYEGVNNKYWDLDYLYTVLENLEYVKNNDHNCIYPLYEMSDGVNKYAIHFRDSISFKDNKIDSITISSLSEEYNYILTFDIYGVNR